MRLARTVLLAAAVAVAAPSPGPRAGAWTQEPGAGQLISSLSRRASPLSSFAGGEVDDDSTYTAIYFDYGLFEDLTIGATAFVEISTNGVGANTAELGVFARYRFWKRDAGDVAAVQLGYVQPVNELLGPSFGGPDSDPTNEVSLRLLYGRGWGFSWGSAFVSAEAGYHLQIDDDEDELRADLTVGARPFECCMGLLSLYSTYPLGDSETAALKIAPSVTYSFHVSEPEEGEDAKPVTLQFGLSQDVLNLDEGIGFQLSVWQPF